MFRMRVLVSAFMLLMVVLAVSFSETASARYETSPEDKSIDGQVWRALAGFLEQNIRNGDGGGSPMCHHKRNSEIINSLLGLPKTMTDAGRK